jgi:NAD(P)-dependent dehydrogenase (short-subunit alcohol dehydrogenase family)
MSYSIDLSGQVAIITGAAKGIGLATARMIAKAGAQIVIDDVIDPSKAKEILDSFHKEDLQATYLQQDISTEEGAQRLVQNVLNQFGRVDILVNNAGVVANWDKSFAVHVKGLFFCSDAVHPHMAERGTGRIINITSTCALTGGTGIPQYVATKAGAYSLTRYLAKTYAPEGILVNAVMPAVIMSDMIMTRYQSEEEMVSHYIPQMPVRRIGYPEDVAGVILFLCSELSNFICGEIITVDGGRMHVG